MPVLLLLLALLAPASAPAPAAAASLAPAAQELPKPDGWVTDLAGMLTPEEERQLEALMESYQEGSGHDIALLTVPDLGGRSLEQYALEVARTWKLGRKDLNDGALLFVAKKERKIRIEVGRGLEGTVTDSIAGRIIRDVISPEFRAGRFGAGLRKGIEALHAAAGGDYAKLPPQRRGRDGKASAGEVLGALLGSCFLPLVLLLVLVNAARRGRRGGRGRGSWVEPMIWGALMGSAMRGGRHRGGGFGGFGGGGGGGFGGFGGGGGFSGGGASGGW